MCQSAAVGRPAAMAKRLGFSGFGSIGRCGKDTRARAVIEHPMGAIGRQMRPITQQSTVVFEIRIKLRHLSTTFLEEFRRHSNLCKAGLVNLFASALITTRAYLLSFYTESDFVLNNCAIKAHSRYPTQ